MGIIKKYDDGSFLEYNRGKFDKWCVYHTNSEGKRVAPRDVDYFKDLYVFSKRYGKDRLYSDYVKIYDRTKKEVEEAVLTFIEQIAKGYDKEDIIKIDTMFTILYMGMIAEERKEHAILGKRIKRLGIHTLLMDNKSIHESANFMRNKKWYDLDKICKAMGF